MRLAHQKIGLSLETVGSSAHPGHTQAHPGPIKMLKGQTMTQAEWVTSWSPTAPIVAHRVVRAAEDGEFEKGPREVLTYKELGLAEATDGRLAAEHIRVRVSEPWQSGFHCHDQDFQFCYVLRGACTLWDRDGVQTVVGPGDVSFLPGLWWHDELVTGDFEVIEILSPAKLQTTHGLDSVVSARAARLRGRNRPVFSFEDPAAYRKGAGPRERLSYRPSSAGSASDARVHGHVTQAHAEGGDAEWRETLSSYFVHVVSGGAELTFPGGETHDLGAGASYCLEPGTTYRLNAWSADFKTFEMWFAGDAPDRPSMS